MSTTDREAMADLIASELRSRVQGKLDPEAAEAFTNFAEYLTDRLVRSGALAAVVAEVDGRIETTPASTNEEGEFLAARFLTETVHHLVRISVTDDVLSDHRDAHTRRKYLLSPHNAISLGTELASSGMRALESITRDALLGDCSACENTRMVLDPQHPKQGWMIHCPDCMGKEPKPVVPTMPAWVESEKKVLY